MIFPEILPVRRLRTAIKLPHERYISRNLIRFDNYAQKYGLRWRPPTLPYPNCKPCWIQLALGNWLLLLGQQRRADGPR
jgi:hypothetical protein